MFVSATTACFPNLGFDEAVLRLVDLEFQRVELAIHESGCQIKPSQVLSHFDETLDQCRRTHRLTPVAFNLELLAEGELYYKQFDACCRLAKALKVVSLTVPSSELGTPFNAEIERLRELAKIASLQGVRVSVRTEAGCMTQDPDTAAVLCDNVKGLGITLDPSHYIFGPHAGRPFDQVIRHTYHVCLRDTNKENFQVCVGKGTLEYNKLLAQLEKHRYDRALSVHITEIPDSGIDHFAELRKMRLLLESMIR